MSKAGDGGVGFSCVNGRGPSVSANADCEIASGMVRRVEDLEARRKGQRVRYVRRVLARRIGVGPGTLANIRRKQRKIIPAWLMISIKLVLIEVLEGERREIEHEIMLLRTMGTDPRDNAFDDLRTRTAALHQMLQETVHGDDQGRTRPAPAAREEAREGHEGEGAGALGITAR